MSGSSTARAARSRASSWSPRRSPVLARSSRSPAWSWRRSEVLHLHPLARRELAAGLDPGLDHVGGLLRVVDVLLAAPLAVRRVVELRPGRELEGRPVRVGRVGQAVLTLEDD